MWNPYADSRIRSVFVGIDGKTNHALLADLLREKGRRIDCLFFRHPEGRASASIFLMMPIQIEVLKQQGVPVPRVEPQIKEEMEKVWRSSHGDNHQDAVQAAMLLDLPAFCCHTPVDNLVWNTWRGNTAKSRTTR